MNRLKTKSDLRTVEFKRNSDAKLKVIKIQSKNNVREEKIAGGEAKQE